MTPDKTPTEAPSDAQLIAELEAAGVAFIAFRGGLSGTKDIWTTSGSQDARKIAAGVRAVLAKWGSPVVAVEPDRYMDDRGYTVTKEWLDSDDATSDYRAAYTTPVYLTPQPTQAQAGAVPLTVEQLYEERQTAIPQLFDLAQQWADNKIHSYQFANEAEKIVDAVARRVESAHGIKEGGQHG